MAAADELAAAVDDEAVREIVRRNGDRHAITGNDLDVKTTQPPADASEERVALIALHAEVTTRERFHHFSLNLDEIVSCHSMPFLPASVWRRFALEVGKRPNSYTNARRTCRYRNAVFP